MGENVSHLEQQGMVLSNSSVEHSAKQRNKVYKIASQDDDKLCVDGEASVRLLASLWLSRRRIQSEGGYISVVRALDYRSRGYCANHCLYSMEIWIIF